VDTATNIIGNLIMIPIYGFMGAVYATLIARVSTNPLNVYFLKRSGINVDIKKYLVPIFIFAVCFLVFLIVGAENIISKSCVIMLFLVLCFAASVIKHKDFNIILNALKRTKVTDMTE
jgi:O-antigen/teichoic acid export membrane protein